MKGKIIYCSLAVLFVLVLFVAVVIVDKKETERKGIEGSYADYTLHSYIEPEETISGFNTDIYGNQYYCGMFTAYVKLGNKDMEEVNKVLSSVHSEDTLTDIMKETVYDYLVTYELGAVFTTVEVTQQTSTQILLTVYYKGIPQRLVIDVSNNTAYFVDEEAYGAGYIQDGLSKDVRTSN